MMQRRRIRLRFRSTVGPTGWSKSISTRSDPPPCLALFDLSHVPEIKEWEIDGEAVRIGAGVTFADAIDCLSGKVPALPGRPAPSALHRFATAVPSAGTSDQSHR